LELSNYSIHGARDSTLFHNKYSEDIPNTQKHELHLCMLHSYGFILCDTMTQVSL